MDDRSIFESHAEPYLPRRSEQIPPLRQAVVLPVFQIDRLVEVDVEVDHADPDPFIEPEIEVINPRSRGRVDRLNRLSRSRIVIGENCPKGCIPLPVTSPRAGEVMAAVEAEEKIRAQTREYRAAVILAEPEIEIERAPMRLVKRQRRYDSRAWRRVLYARDG